MNVQSAIRGSTAAGSPTVNDSASQLQGARPIPVPSVLADHNTSPSISTSDYTLDLHGAQVRKEVPSLLLKEAFLFSEKEKTTVLPSPKPRMEPTHRYLLDAARNLKEFSRPSLWKQSFALIVRHMPGAYEYGKFLSLRDQPSAPHKQTLTVKQTDAIAAAVAASSNDALLPSECSKDVDRLVKGYLQWRKEKSTTTEPISVSCCMQLLKNLHRDACSANSVNDDNGIHEYLAEIVSDKSIALSEAAKLEQQSPLLALFMYKLMEHIAPGLTASLEVDSNVLHEKPEVCALLAATLQGRFEIAEALTKNGGEAAQLQQQLLEIDANQLQQLLPLLLHDHAWTAKHLSHLKEMDRHQLKHLLPLLLHDHAWTTEHLPLLKDVSGIQLQYLLPLLQHDQAWTTRHLPLLKEMGAFAMIHLLPLLQHDHAWTTRHLPLLKDVSGIQLQYLLPLLQHDHAWTTRHLPLLKEMGGAQLQYLLPLLLHDHAWTTKHLPLLKEMGGTQLQYLLPLLKHDQAWTAEHLPLLKEMDAFGMEYLFPLLQHDQAWTTRHLPLLKGMDGVQLHYLLPLLQHDKAWTTRYLPLLKKMGAFAMTHLLPLLQHDQAWTTRYLLLLKEMDVFAMEHLLPLLQYDQAWTTEHLPLLKEMDGHQLKHLLPLLRYDRAWTTEHLHHLRKIAEDQLYHLARFSHLKSMDISSEGFTRAANPYVREALSLHNQDMEELTKELQTHGASLSIFHPERNMEEPTRVLKTHGASRSIFHSEREIASYLTEKFKSNYQKIPNATFGVENEMFIPGIHEFASFKIENELNDRLGIKNKKYRYGEDQSLSTDASFATPPIEQITSILDAPEDIQRLQSALSILNDWGAFTNRTAGVHIHTGIKQWKAADCLTTLEEKSKNRFLHQWDQDLPKQFPGKTITPYQLLFMKQFLVNMVAMQKDFYLVSKRSRYSEPNGPMSENDLDKYYENVSSARDYEELLSSTDVDVNDANARRLNVNLIAYKKHGTIEVRGFTKKNSDHMEVDPNLPVRDLIFMQEALIKVLHDTKHILLSGVSPNDPIEVRPSTGLTEIVKEYVQDVFLLEIIHALGQRNPEQRVKTMEAIVEDTDLIASETLQKIRESQAALLEGDQLAQHFLTALNRDAQWNPSFVEGNPLKRINSLRSMADAGLADSEWIREGFEQGAERGDTPGTSVPGPRDDSASREIQPVKTALHRRDKSF